MGSGSGYCFRGQLQQDVDGRISYVNKTDLRGFKSLQTENLGKIRVLRKKINLTWLEKLPPLLDFLEKCKNEQIIVFTKWGKPGFAQLLAAYKEGFGMDDWAAEEISNMGEEGKEKLLEKLMT